MKTTMKSVFVACASAAMLLGLTFVPGATPIARAQTAPAGAPAPLTGTWNIDPMHTSTTFSIRHLGISEVHGRFDDISGTIIANADHPEMSFVDVTIQAASIDTQVKMRDDDLRSNHYFDVAMYPTITFKSTEIDSGRHGNYVAVGDLTIHGVTKQVRLPFHLNGPIKDPFGGSRIGLTTELHINRQDYGVGGSDKILDGDFAIGNDVTISISCEAVPPSAAPA